jgi:hypothetical protein
MALPRLHITTDGRETEPATIITANLSAADALALNPDGSFLGPATNELINDKGKSVREYPRDSALGSDVASAISVAPPLCKADLVAVCTTMGRYLGGAAVQDLRDKYLETTYADNRPDDGGMLTLPNTRFTYLRGPKFPPPEVEQASSEVEIDQVTQQQLDRVAHQRKKALEDSRSKRERTKTSAEFLAATFILPGGYYEGAINTDHTVLFSGADISWEGLKSILDAIDITSKPARTGPPPSLRRYLQPRETSGDDSLVIGRKLGHQDTRAIESAIRLRLLAYPSGPQVLYDMSSGHTIREAWLHNHGPLENVPTHDTCVFISSRLTGGKVLGPTGETSQFGALRLASTSTETQRID